MASTATLARQVINIGIQSNDGTGDSIREAFRKTNDNFIQLYNRLNATGAGFTFYGGNTLIDTPAIPIANRILVTDPEFTVTQVDLVGGTGIEITKVTGSGTDNTWRIINTSSSLITDGNPTLSTDLNGNNYRATAFADPIDDKDLVTRKYLYDNFLNRKGIYQSGSTGTTSTIAGGSNLTENISLNPPVNSDLTGKTIKVFANTTTNTSFYTNVDLSVQATAPEHLVRKDYVDTKLSLQGTETIDPATGSTNTSFGKMTGPLVLSRNPQTSDDRNFNGLIAATKAYVDSNSFYSANNLFVTQKGRDYQPEVPPERRGRSTAYAFKTINKAAQYAEQLINTSRIIVGDYARLITYNNGTPATVADVADNYYGNDLARLRLNVGTLGSDQFGVAESGKFTIFPGQYIEGVDSKAIALIENLQKGENPGDPEVYSIAYVDYGDDFNTAIDATFAYPDDPLKTNFIKFTFKDTTMVPIPDFWVGYQFYTNDGIQGTIVEIGDEFISENVNYKEGLYTNFFVVEFTDGAPDPGFTKESTEWHVYAGDFIPGETVVYNTNVSSLQITLVVESGEYYEQYPIKLAANVSIRGDEFRRCIIRPAAGPSSSKWANTYFRRDAQTDGLQTAELDYSTDYTTGGTLVGSTAIPSGSNGVISIALSTGSIPDSLKGYMFVGNGGQGIITDVYGSGFTVNLGTELLNAAEISSGNWHIYRPILFGYHYLRDSQRPMNLLTTVKNSGGAENAAKLLTLNRSFIQDEVIAFIDNTFASTGTFTYDKDLCRRDIGLIVDSLSYDLVYGGSERTIYAGESYRDVTVVKETEAVETAAAVTYLNTIAQNIITNTLVGGLSTSTQVRDESIVSEGTAGDVIADLSQALARIIRDDPEYNPPKNNDQLDVFLMNDANVIRYVSCQNHGGFMQVLDPVGQIKNKSPYTQTASSFSQSIAKQRFAGGMLVDGFAGNVMCTPVDWDPVASPLALNVTGLIRRPQVPTFFMNKGVRYEVDFFANFQPDYLDSNGVQRYKATLRLNPLIPGGISNSVTVLDTTGGFQPNQTNIPITIEQPTGIGGLGARGYATSDATGAIETIVITFPGTGYESTPFLNVGGAIFNNLTIVAGKVTGASIVSGGYGYDVGCRFEIVPVGIVGGVKAIGEVTEIDNGTGTREGVITKISITNGGANWTSSVNYRVTFGNLDIGVPTPSAGFLDEAPEEVELVTAGNRSMLANDFTQVNDLGYGIFVTNGGFMENVSMFTYYCHRSYYSLNGSQVRTLTGSSVYGNWGLVADGSDPMEVPLSLTNVFPMVQIAKAYVNNPLFTAQAGQTYIYVEIDSISGGYPPLNGSMIEVNHGGIRKQYSVGSATPALNSQNEVIPNVYQLFFNTGNVALGTEGTGLLTEVGNGAPIIIRASTLVKVTGFNPVSIARPSTSLTWNDDSTYIYHITGFSNVQPDGSVFAYTQEDYNYIVFQAIDQGVSHPTLLSGGTGYTSSATTATISSVSIIGSVTRNVNGTQGLGTIGVQTISLDSVTNVKVGHRVSTGTYILPDTYVTWVDTDFNRICISNPTVGPIPDATPLTFTASYPSARAQVSSGTVTSIIIDDAGSGWNATITNINIVGDGIGAVVASPIKISGVAGSDVVKITSLDLTSQNRILSGLAEVPKRYYQFAFGDELYNITGYSTPSSRGVAFEVAVTAEGTGTTYSSVAVSEPGSGYSLYQELTILGNQLGGISPENDLKLIVTAVNSSGGVVAVSFTGTSYQSLVSVKNYTNISPPDNGLVSAEITLNKPLAESISKGTILRASIPINSPGKLTTKISILRATSHDFVDIGTGGYATTRIPNDLYGPPTIPRKPTQEVLQLNRGRVYYVSSDQDGNFRVGDALTVNQAQGSVTISVPLDLSNLSAISLRRDLGPPINEFSVDSTMITEADYKVPTEQAVANYINRRLGLDRNGNIYAGSPLGPQFLALDGQLAMKADINMASHRIVNLITPQNSTDVSNKGYVDTKLSSAGQASVDVDNFTRKPEWGRMTGSLQLFDDPNIKTATVASTATIGDTKIKFNSLSSPSYQPGDLFGARIIGDGIPVGTVIGTIYPDGQTLGLENPDTENNVPVTANIVPGTVIYFDPVKQAATKKYVDKRSQLINLADVSVSSATDVDLLMFGPPAPVSTSSGINPSIYTSSTWLVNVSNNLSAILNTPTSIGGGSDISLARSGNTVTFKLRGGTLNDATNPITDYHINSWAQIQQSKLLMNTATTTATAWVGTQSQIQARLGLASFDSRMFTATSGWVTLVNSTGTTSGVQPAKQAWIPAGGGLLGATNTLADNPASYVTSASVKTWLGNETSAWNISADFLPQSDTTFNLGSQSKRWGIFFANTLTLDGGLILNTKARISSDQATADLFTTTVTTLNVGGPSGTVTLGYPTLVGTQATQNVYNTVATTVNAFGAATSMTMGAATGFAIIRNPNLVMPGGLTFAMNGSNPSITTVNSGTASVFNANATSGNLFGSASNIVIGGTTGTLAIRNSTVTLPNANSLNINGTDPTIATINTGIASVFNTNASTGNLFGDATTINIGAALSTSTFGGDIRAFNIYDNSNRVVTTVDAATAGYGLSISAENSTGPIASFTVSSNATSTNTASTLVYRNASGNFSAGIITANLNGTVTPSILSGNTATDIFYATVGDNDYIRLRVGANATNQGWAEIATADNGNEPIYVRQYVGLFATPVATATILDATGNTIFPKTVYMSGLAANGGNGTVSGNWTLLPGSTWQATFADLAEYYTADEIYEPGTVLVFGGEKEVTATDTYADIRVAGVVSTNAAYIMNAECVGTRACIALQGRVPVKVVGKVRKGDLLTTSDQLGYATKSLTPAVGTIIGKALENKETDEPGIIEVAIGRM